VRRCEKHELKPESAHTHVTTYITLRYIYTVNLLSELVFLKCNAT